MQRHRGIIISLHPPDANGKVGVVRAIDDVWHGTKLAIHSVKDRVVLVVGIEVNFRIGSLKSGGHTKEVALDLDIEEPKPKRPAETVQDKVLRTLSKEQGRKDADQRKVSFLTPILDQTASEFWDQATGGAGNLGMGGPQHRFLQTFVAKIAEKLGWSADLERKIGGKQEATDVVLEKHGVCIACEISISTSGNTEWRNLKKNVDAGFPHVVSMALSSAKLDAIRRYAVRKLGVKVAAEKLQFLLPEDLEAFLVAREEAVIQRQQPEQVNVICGYRVIVRHRAVSLQRQEERNRVLAGIIVRCTARLRERRGEK